MGNLFSSGAPGAPRERPKSAPPALGGSAAGAEPSRQNDPDHWRNLASGYATRRGELLERSRAAFARGDKAEAKRLSDLGKQQVREGEEGGGGVR